MATIRCISDGAFATGVEDHDDDGFAYCPVCQYRMRQRFAADPQAPRVKHPAHSKGVAAARERLIAGLVQRFALRLAEHAGEDFSLARQYYLDKASRMLRAHWR